MYIAVDKWSIKILHSSKDCSPNVEDIKLIMIIILELWISLFSKFLNKVNNSWGDTNIFVKVHRYSLVKGNLSYVSHEITIIAIALLKWACSHWDWKLILCNIDEDSWVINSKWVDIKFISQSRAKNNKIV